MYTLDINTVIEIQLSAIPYVMKNIKQVITSLLTIPLMKRENNYRKIWKKNGQASDRTIGYIEDE